MVLIQEVQMNASSEPIDQRVRHGSNGEMGRLFADVEDLLKHVMPMKDDDIARLRARVEGSLSNARDAVTRNASRVRETATEAADATDQYVRRRPWTVAGVAMVAGMLVGAALRSSRR
jgi:ElaB/YqjD/DUF883 family membrane-anchored ribosome-binding protein